MRITSFIIILSISSTSFSQLREGFDPDEAKSLIAICNSYSFLKLLGADSLIIPENYRKVFTSEVIGFDNMFQVYEFDNLGIINFRGSTDRTSSWVENLYSAMIPGEGIIKINDEVCHYKFASDTSAAVHSGYALSVVLLSSKVMEQINKLNEKGIYNILITGHSQGGAIAHLFHAYLENLPVDKITPTNVFKIYTFANPMCGNKEFADEYNLRYSEVNMSYSIINPDDLIPKMPVHFQENKSVYGAFFYKNWADLITKWEMPNLKDQVLQIFEPVLTKYIKFSNRLIEKVVATTYLSIDMPDYIEDINYFPTGSIRKIEPFSYPKIQIDTLGMLQKEIAKLKRGKDGNYYHKEPSFFQHKPYQYYVSILKEYFSKDYRELDFLYLPEELE